MKRSFVLACVGIVAFGVACEARGLSKGMIRGARYVSLDGSLAQLQARTGCFPPRLVSLIGQLRSRIGPIEITSGFRPGRHSMHAHCAAVDFRPLAVSSRTAVAVMRTLPGVGGIGQYRHKAGLLHMDVGERREWTH